MAKVAESFEQTLRQKFAEFVTKRNAGVSSVIDTLQTMRMRGWTAFVFGGIPRGVFDDGRRHQPRDLDLVFDDEHFVYFESAFEHCLQRKNSYGGLRLRINNMVVDAWPLSGTWAFREGLVKHPSFENLPSTTFLNIDGVIVEAVVPPFKKRRVYEAGFFTGWNERTLDINLMENPHPGICVARTLHISKRYGFKVSHRLAMYLLQILTTRSVREIESAQASHYGRVEFDLDHLGRIRQRLEKHLNSSSLFPFALFALPTVQGELHLKAG